MPRLTSELKSRATVFILATVNDLVSIHFDRNERCGKKIEVERDTMHVTIRRNSFAETDTKPYFEDYHIFFKGTIENEEVWSDFYLEWRNGDMSTGVLVPANTVWDPITGRTSCPKITIRRQKKRKNYIASL